MKTAERGLTGQQGLRFAAERQLDGGGSTRPLKVKGARWHQADRSEMPLPPAHQPPPQLLTYHTLGP